MFGMGWSEMMVVGIVALIVVGPKDLPGMFRTLGEFTGKARGMAREFSRAMEAAADDAGVKDISRTIKAAGNPQQFGVDKLREAAGYPKGSATEALSKDRAIKKSKIEAAAAEAATKRRAGEAAAMEPTPEEAAEFGDEAAMGALDGDAVDMAATDGSAGVVEASEEGAAAVKPVAKAPRKAAAKKPAAKKPAAKKTAAKKTVAAKKPAAKKPAAARKPKTPKAEPDA